ncbi:MAG TPA: diguanylate cyclase, partial [Nitrospira sp.]|nr:diguanylate cyclase [Nitrospira sp.]
MADVLPLRVVIGWTGLFIAAGFGVAGLLCWPYGQNLARCKQDGAPSAYDGMTGLPTRRLFLVLLKQALSRAETTKRHVAVLVCALEQFRPLSAALAAPNMTLVVRVQAARIKSALRPHDVVTRLDEYTFAVIADNLESPDEARLIAEKIQHAIALP